MDDIRIGSLGFVDLPSDKTKGDPKKRSKPKHVESHEESTDQVTLHSTDESEELPPGYAPVPSDEDRE
jgi:hypothetical protein